MTTEHVHVANIVREEVLREPPVPGYGGKKFIYPTCGGKDGCGAVLMDGLWFTNPDRERRYATDGKEGR